MVKITVNVCLPEIVLGRIFVSLQHLNHSHCDSQCLYLALIVVKRIIVKMCQNVIIVTYLYSCKFCKLLHNLACKGVAYLLIRELPFSSPLQAKMYLVEMSNLKDLWLKNKVKNYGICHLLIREFCMKELPYK
ncbi:Hypothetical_protein [Hexamita inflata]|uniref:Hypothetical_protein n=1 Tax=Hexamita inflata TaxID=28002 RepID=A0AA86Q526_9EUKA|nr:Hypothetical protein HINF_LOCUS33579 [Hexamita inflata]